MNHRRYSRYTAEFLIWTVLFPWVGVFSQSPPEKHSAVPRTWDDDAISRLEVPLANPIGSPKHITNDYDYKIPVRPIYKQYPVYAPRRQPAGYMDWLKQQEPVVLWNDAGIIFRLQPAVFSRRQSWTLIVEGLEVWAHLVSMCLFRLWPHPPMVPVRLASDINAREEEKNKRGTRGVGVELA